MGLPKQHAIPVIDYADRRPGQPLDSLFEVAVAPDGVTVTKPLSAEPVRAAVAYMFAAVMVVAAMAAVIGLVSGPVRPWYEYLAFALPLTTPACFAPAALFYASAVGRPRTLWIVIDPSGLTLRNGPVTLGNRPWRVPHPVRFRAGIQQVDVGRMRLACPLLLTGRRALDREVLRRLPPAECRWLANVLNDGIARANGTAASTVIGDA